MVRASRSTTIRRPDGFTKSPSESSTATTTCRPRTTKLVGSPPTSTTPPGWGSAGSAMSTKPISPCSPSVYTNWRPSPDTSTISATAEPLPAIASNDATASNARSSPPRPSDREFPCADAGRPPTTNRTVIRPAVPTRRRHLMLRKEFIALASSSVERPSAKRATTTPSRPRGHRQVNIRGTLRPQCFVIHERSCFIRS